MKKFLSSILVIITLFSLCCPALAKNDLSKGYTIIVNDKMVDLSDLPVAPYQEKTVVMVPLRKISEALGYQVTWNSETQTITVDDEYIQKAILLNKSNTITFEGKLQIINMSREIDIEVPVIIHNGYTYVPLDFFKEFLNDTTIQGNTITITPSKSELHSDIK